MYPTGAGWKNSFFSACLFIACGFPQVACSPVEIVAGIAGTTIFTGLAPSNSLEQIYYLGVFDPHEQLPANIYRVTVRGQASSFSQMNFGSGWVNSRVVDSLSTPISVDAKTGKVNIGTAEDGELSELTGNRRLVLFGPEGFREAPKDHRLVIVMGASPEAYFQAIDSALGTVAQVQHEQLQGTAKEKILQALLNVSHQQERLKDLEMNAKLMSLAGGGK